MKQNNELHSIENQFDLGHIQTNSYYVWPFLRQRVYFEIIKNRFNFNSKLRTRNKLQLIKNTFYGFSNVFKLKFFDYLFFNNADKRTIVKNNKRFDVFFDAWADKLGQDKSLFIEWAIDKHYPAKQTYSKHVLSDLVFKYIIAIAGFFLKKPKVSIGEINKIKEEYRIDFDVDKELHSKFVEVYIYKLLFKIIKPKAVFLISSFTKIPIIVAAHHYKIKVYEAQHGYIGDNHQFYNSKYDFGTTYYPDYLLSFGRQEKATVPLHFIFKPSQIIPIGSLHLEDIKTNFKSKELELLKSKYDKLFCVSLQTVKEEELLRWVNEQAELHSNRLFIIKPKNNNLDYSKYVAMDNCMLLPQYNTYEILKYADYNITIYSTTAVEAPYFGTKTLFFNIDDLSVKYFDFETLFSDLIQNAESLNENHLELQSNMQKPSYFVNHYYQNVTSVNLDF